MRWADLTWQEIDKIDRATPVILNLASIEQHGPHLPVSTDSDIGNLFTEEMNRRLGERVLVLPQIKVCCSEHHMDFPGTLTVRHETMLAYVMDMLEAVAKHGFRNILLVNSHGGNQAIGAVVLEKFGAAHQDCQIALVTWWKMAADKLADIRESEFCGLGHACEFETSLMMYGAPAAVRRDLISGLNHVPTYSWANFDMLTASPAALFRTIKAMSGGTGVLGDPSLASAEKGGRIVEAVLGYLIEIAEDMRTGTHSAGEQKHASLA